MHDRGDRLIGQRAHELVAQRVERRESATFVASHCFDQRRSWRSMKPAGRPNSARPTSAGSIVCRSASDIHEPSPIAARRSGVSA